VIPIVRLRLDDELATRLNSRSAQLQTSHADAGAARKAWKSAELERHGIRAYLAKMAPGIQRCMYCGDNLGTDIDHFEPISSAPIRTFEWFNHLLACSFCNSNCKRHLFPRDLAGKALLIDPTTDDPSPHLALRFSDGKYRALSPRGQASIDVFGLNRADLAIGRAKVFFTRRATLCYARGLFDQKREAELIHCLDALAVEPHASVLHAIVQTLPLPTAADVLGADVIAALGEPAFLKLVRRVASIPASAQA
jgi:hypothetical protein